MSEEVKYEYLVVYKPAGDALFRSPGRRIKQTLSGAEALVKWATGRGYDVRLQRRAVGDWEDALDLKEGL